MENPMPEPPSLEELSSDPPLSADQSRELVEASRRLGHVLFSARVASFTGWTVGIFGARSLVLGLFSVAGLLVGGALLAVAWNEFRGRRMLRGLDPEGARILGWNQLALLGVVAAWCLWSIYRARVAPSPSVETLEALAGLEPGFVAGLTTLVYGAVLVVVGIVQGILARYHFGREERVRKYLKETADWIVEVQRAVTAGLARRVVGRRDPG